MQDYGSILKHIGYDLTDRGNYWQCAAVYRSGDNKTALRIYKDTGIWSDFVKGEGPYPFSLLLKKTLKTDKIDDILSNVRRIEKRNLRLLKEEKTWSESCLRKLLPDREYFESRGISAATQATYRCGLATGGKLYQRIVFPVFRYDGKIHGFAGRKALQDNNRPPWLNHGKSADWFYPYFSIKETEEQIKEQGAAFVVESIGDSMALFQGGVKNNLVTFTNRMSPKFIAKLANLGVKIVVCANNDEGQNRGFDGALSSILNLSDVVDFSNIWFHPCPIKGDFNNMQTEEIVDWRKSLELSDESSKKSLIELTEYSEQAIIAKSLDRKLNRLKKHVAQF